MKIYAIYTKQITVIEHVPDMTSQFVPCECTDYLNAESMINLQTVGAYMSRY